MDKTIETELGVVKKVKVESMDFLYMEGFSDIESQKKAWSKFEEKFPSLTGRKMYGLDYVPSKVYRVCSLVLKSDDEETFGLNRFTFEGGTYMRLRLKFNLPELYEKIGPAYDFLLSQYEEIVLWSLPFIEHYKAENVLDIFIPIEK